jgi:hypothetical protein
VKFWDSSAIVPVLVDQPTTPHMRALLERDPKLVVWWASEVECSSALARLVRENVVDASTERRLSDRLREFSESWEEVQPGVSVREAAKRLLRIHPLRAADALQLAAAIVASQRDPASLEFVTLDGRLADAARKEGFSLVDLPAA